MNNTYNNVAITNNVQFREITFIIKEWLCGKKLAVNVSYVMESTEMVTPEGNVIKSRISRPCIDQVEVRMGGVEIQMTDHQMEMVNKECMDQIIDIEFVV